MMDKKITMTKIIDEDGEWIVYGNTVKTLIEPSQKWIDEHPVPEPEPAPEPEPDDSAIWDELAAAYQEGVNSIDE